MVTAISTGLRTAAVTARTALAEPSAQAKQTTIRTVTKPQPKCDLTHAAYAKAITRRVNLPRNE